MTDYNNVSMITCNDHHDDVYFKCTIRTKDGIKTQEKVGEFFIDGGIDGRSQLSVRNYAKHDVIVGMNDGKCEYWEADKRLTCY